jgi:pyrrolysine biosynthesis protein PylC
VKLLVVGGKLQGIEAAYLAGKVGWDVVLVDRRPAPPAAGLVAEHVAVDIAADESAARALVASCDAVLPACEDLDTLEWLDARVEAWGRPLLFDLAAYRVTQSKAASRELFERLGVPLPAPWPACGFPAVVKPDVASGSDGVTVVHHEAALEAAVAALRAGGHEPVVEEYVAGPSLSYEVLAAGRRAHALQVTGLEFDAAYDCKRVVAPVGETGPDGEPAPVRADGSTAWEQAVPEGTMARFAAASERLALGLGLRGLMDVEVMVRDGEPLLLEIDARLPSQTPTAVYWSSGLNILEELHATLTGDAPPAAGAVARRACVYQHVSVHDGVAEVCGEHIMGSARPLHLVPGFYGADEALTDHAPGARTWCAPPNFSARTAAEARAAADDAVRALAAGQDLELVLENGQALLVREVGT